MALLFVVGTFSCFALVMINFNDIARIARAAGDRDVDPKDPSHTKLVYRYAFTTMRSSRQTVLMALGIIGAAASTMLATRILPPLLGFDF